MNAIQIDKIDWMNKPTNFLNRCVPKMRVPFYSEPTVERVHDKDLYCANRQSEKPPQRVKTRTNPLCSQAASSFQSSVCGPAQTSRCPRRPGRPAGEHRCGGCQVCCSKTVQRFLQYNTPSVFQAHQVELLYGLIHRPFLAAGARGWDGEKKQVTVVIVANSRESTQ